MPPPAIPPACSGVPESCGATASADGSTSSGGGDATASESTSEGSSTGAQTSRYEGSYEGAWEGSCPSFPILDGGFEMDIDVDGMLVGTASGILMGTLDGEVDDAGSIDAIAMLGPVGRCSFVGGIDDAGGVSGTWECPESMCIGTWIGSRVE